MAIHRSLFRRRRKGTLVEVGHRVSQLGLALLGAAMVSVVALIFSMVFSNPVGFAAACVAAVMFLGAWLILPLSLRRRMDRAG